MYATIALVLTVLPSVRAKWTEPSCADLGGFQCAVVCKQHRAPAHDSAKACYPLESRHVLREVIAAEQLRGLVLHDARNGSREKQASGGADVDAVASLPSRLRSPQEACVGRTFVGVQRTAAVELARGAALDRSFPPSY